MKTNDNVGLFYDWFLGQTKTALLDPVFKNRFFNRLVDSERRVILDLAKKLPAIKVEYATSTHQSVEFELNDRDCAEFVVTSLKVYLSKSIKRYFSAQTGIVDKLGKKA